MHTPEQAKTLWCPMVRVGGENWSDARGLRGQQYNTCIADQCAMWQWKTNTKLVEAGPEHEGMGTVFIQGKRLISVKVAPTEGFCGLAGRPQ
jgi:hypothetical protein